MLATLVDAPFDSPNHLFEVKWDGVRTIAHIEEGRVVLHSRSLRDVSHQFPELNGLRGQLDGRRAIVDGEIVSFTKEGKPSFNQLQTRLGLNPGMKASGRADKAPVNFQVFDILYLDDECLLERPLVQRKEILAARFKPGPFAQPSDYILEDGCAYFEAITQLGLEGMVAKEIRSPYLPGKRTKAWQKVKVYKFGEFVVGGYTFGGGYRGQFFGALMLGLYDEQGDLCFLGQVGGGFSDALLKQVMPLLEQRHTATSPFADPPKVDKFSFWCEPTLVCKVRYAEITDQGKLRFPIFDSLRLDANPRDCTFSALTPEHQ